MSTLRRSPRLANKHTVKYYTEKDELDDITEAIHEVCDKKGWIFTDDLVTDFYEFISFIPKDSEFIKNIYSIDKYGNRIINYVPKTKPEIAKDWALHTSKTLIQQKRLQKFNNAIIKYCQKNNIEYNHNMNKLFALWMADPFNKEYLKDYEYDYIPYQHVKKWFSTLKKQSFYKFIHTIHNKSITKHTTIYIV